MTGALPGDLAWLVAALRRETTTPSSEARFAPEPGEDREAWLAEVVAVRLEHDAAARASRAALVRLQRESEGHDARTLLGLPAQSADRRPWDVHVPVGGMRALAPDVADGTGASAGGCVVPATRVGDGSGASPVVVRLHGGAFWMGGGATRDVTDRDLVDALVERLGAVVIDVDHRLVPEHPFPAAVEDVLATLDAVRAGADRLRIDPARIALLGTSSGGSIAMAAARIDGLREAAPPLAALALVVPSLDLASLTPASRASDAGVAARRRLLRAYLGEQDASGEWGSPARLERLTGLPPTFAGVAAYDEVALGGEEACAAIVRGGGTAQSRRYPMTHTVLTAATEARVATDVCDFIEAQLLRA